MSIFRVNKTEDYTTMSNHHLRNKKLSLKAKGLMSFMLSLPDDWDYSINGLVAVSIEGETSIKSILKELKDNGYLQIKKERNPKGMFEYIYDIYEIPNKLDNSSNIEIEETLQDNPEIDEPTLEKPEVENPAVDNQGQINTNKQILNNNIKKKIKKKKADKTKNEKSYDEIIEEYTQNIELRDTLNEFIKMRKKIKKPLTEYALELIIKELDKLAKTDDNKKIAILNQSITKSWQGVFDVQTHSSNKSNKQVDTQNYKEAEIDDKSYGQRLKEAIKNRLNGG